MSMVAMPAENVSDPRRLHPMAIIGDFLRQLPQYVIAIVAGGSALLDGGIGIYLFLGGGGAAGLAALIRWYHFRYTVSKDGLLIESGVISRQRRSIGFDRVQDIEIERNLLARLTGTAHVRLETGGSAEDEGDLSSVSDHEANALRLHLKHWREQRGTALPAPMSSSADKVMYQMSLPQVLQSGIYRFSFILLAIFGGLFQFIQPDEQTVLALLGSDMQVLIQERIEAGLGLSLALAGLAGLLVVGIVSGIVMTLLRDYGFRLTADFRGLTRKRGLLTRTEAAIPFRRIQAAALDSGPMRRLAGKVDLSFQTLGSGKRSGGRQEAAPFAATNDIEKVLASAEFSSSPPQANFHVVTGLMVVRAVAKAAVFSLIVITAGLLFQPILWPLAAVLSVILLLFSVLGAISEGHLIEDERLSLRQGWWRQRVWLIPYENLQIAEITQGPVQRIAGAATLHVDIAGAPTIRPARLQDVQLADAERLMLLLSQKVGRSAGVI
ncbi:MAG: PH domain-containing protein, partial [Pacificimonas sp.]